MEKIYLSVDDLTDKEILNLIMCKAYKMFGRDCASCPYNIGLDRHTVCIHENSHLHYLHKHTRSMDVVTELHDRYAVALEKDTEED